MPDERDIGLARGDARTLSLAGVRIDSDRLDRLLRYQRALADGLAQGWTPANLARAQEQALEAAGLRPEVVEPLLAVLRRFAGNRLVAAELRKHAPTVIGDRAEDLSQRLAALDRQLAERDDPETVRRLLEREAEVVGAHQRLRDALNG
jgi:hypothetical protein